MKYLIKKYPSYSVFSKSPFQALKFFVPVFYSILFSVSVNPILTCSIRLMVYAYCRPESGVLIFNPAIIFQVIPGMNRIILSKIQLLQAKRYYLIILFM